MLGRGVWVGVVWSDNNKKQVKSTKNPKQNKNNPKINIQQKPKLEVKRGIQYSPMLTKTKCLYQQTGFEQNWRRH